MRRTPEVTAGGGGSGPSAPSATRRGSGAGHARRAGAVVLAVVLLLVVLLPASAPAAVSGVRAARPPRAGAAGAAPARDAVRSGTAFDGERAWPLAGRPRVVRGWEPSENPYGPGHRGVDLAAGTGAVVRAAATGRVSFAGQVAGRGVVAVEVAGSGDPPLRFTYEPVRAHVAKGDEVAAGQLVGTTGTGASHCAARCLHWGLRREDTYLDPLSLLPRSLLLRGPSRLLPVFGVPVPQAAPQPTRAVRRRTRGVRGGRERHDGGARHDGRAWRGRRGRDARRTRVVWPVRT
ncbi:MULTISPECIES: murein hydrolase activator EnvC family protein [Streptomyces]|uniref:M23 family metallopeptidase n=1 Tax=Streptomyces salyersiae TaxID=3075530 RepID=A0ABU2RIL8_9ACTN|nr:M23 family metallopeptidase [Streptomyces sp. DSM 41770]MDT0428708.1 M23 family metallopeptidase [Streptomyces sp. DSM 41770]